MLLNGKSKPNFNGLFEDTEHVMKKKDLRFVFNRSLTRLHFVNLSFSYNCCTNTNKTHKFQFTLRRPILLLLTQTSVFTVHVQYVRLCSMFYVLCSIFVLYVVSCLSTDPQSIYGVVLILATIDEIKCC